jgi:hypothetical protein
MFDNRNVCCRVRMLLALPSDEQRRGWIARWMAKGDPQVDQVRDELNRQTGRVGRHGR